MKNIEAAKPLNLENAYNVRDLGCYSSREGKKLREGRFLRADSLGSLNEEDWKKLKRYGVVSIVDLRSSMERDRQPFAVEKSEGIAYHSIPLFDNIQSNDGTQQVPKSLYELYCSLLDNSQQQIAEVLRTFLEYEDGCCLFNCTAGKDRTGIIAMLLLGLAGVDEDYIIADYSASAENMKSVFAGQIKAMEQAGYGAMIYLLRSEPEEMRRTLDYVEEQYGGIREYLKKLLTKEEMEALYTRFQ